MLHDAVEIEIMSKARQPNLQDPTRSQLPFESIARDFMPRVEFEGQVILDLGPGQFDFADILRARGAEVHAVDNDPAVLELGRHRGYTVFEADLRRLAPADLPVKYDGIFCRGSINAFWFGTEADVRAHIQTLTSLLKETAWGWIAPWNGTREPPENSGSLLAAQAEAFRSARFKGVDLPARVARRFGVTTTNGPRALYFRNLRKPWRLALSREL